MSKVNWTKEQEQAIYESGSNILVAAAAGSGKTAVLVERIINKIINENIDIDKLLVVTFTNAAASEMRERVLDAIYNKLEENPEDVKLQRQITLLNKASICTIDSFCLDVIKNNFFEIDVSPNFRIADTAEISLLEQDVLEELFEKKYENHDEDFIKLINTYTSYRDDTPLKELVLRINSYIQSNPFPLKWLEEKVEMYNSQENIDEDFAKTIWGESLLSELEEELIDDILMLQKAKMQLAREPELDKYEKIIDEDINSLQTLKTNLDSWDKSYEIANNLKFRTWPTDRKLIYEEKDAAKNIRDIVKKKLKKKTDKILAFNSKEANQDLYDMYEILNLLKNLILEFDKEFEKAKREKNILDFSDIEHLALKILLSEDEEGNMHPSEVAKMYQERFFEIAIDEYQDSNLVQEAILKAIQKNNNIFMVGDVKQSIYRFRQARPELFLEKYANYKLKEFKKDNDNLKIKLFKNFRSRENILDFTNLIFENIMSGLLGDIEYDKDEFLNLGANYEKLEESNLKTEISIINLKEDDHEEDSFQIDDADLEETKQIVEAAELEAKVVAKNIQKIINTHQKVYDMKKSEFRDVTYKDIVILLRSTKDLAPIFEREIINLGMPVFSDASAEYLDSIEIQTIMAILKVIDNPLNDIPLVTSLRSAIGGFTDNDLVQIRLSDKSDSFYNALLKARLNVDDDLKSKIDFFVESIDRWREAQEFLGLDELIWKIYTDTGFYNYVGLMPNGNLRQANLKKLFEKAKQYETASFKGLFNFINFIEKLQLSSGDLGSAKLIGENEDVIRIMSIHKSKGLEFPIVFLACTGKQFNLMDLNSSVLLHHDFGFGVKYINYDCQIEYDTLSKAAVRNALLHDTLSEEMRILYVALTRAKEKLFITATCKDANKTLDDLQNAVHIYHKVDNKINPVLVKKYKRFIDWILLTRFYNASEFENLANLSILNKKDIVSGNNSQVEEIDVISILEEAEDNEEELDKIKKLLDYKYPYSLATVIPTKSSVSKIKQSQEKENHVLLDEFAKSDENTNDDIDFEVPKFIKEDKDEIISSARRGSLIHLCLQKLNYKKSYSMDDIKALIQDLQDRMIISESEANAINPYKIFQFTKSKIWQEVRQAKAVYQEKPFYLNISAKEVFGIDIEENVLIQGIVDLFYIDKDNNLVLVDYKTDYTQPGKEQELINKYKKQLDIYSRALEKSYHKKVFKKIIYSVYLDKEFLVS